MMSDEKIEEQELESLVITSASTPSSRPSSSFTFYSRELEHVSSSSLSTQRTNHEREKARVRIRKNPTFKKSVILIIILTFMIGLFILHFDKQSIDLSEDAILKSSILKGKSVFSCPSRISKSENDKNEDLVEWYDERREKELQKFGSEEKVGVDINNGDQEETVKSLYPTNMTEEEIDKLKNNNYDGSEWTYYEFKSVMFEWKSRYLLKSGDKIFEVSCHFIPFLSDISIILQLN